MKKETFTSHRKTRFSQTLRERNKTSSRGLGRWIRNARPYMRRVFGGIIILFIISIGAIWGIFLRDLPDIHTIETGGYFNESTILYDKYGEEIYSFGDQGKRVYVEYDQISQSIKDALIATEDKRFFENPGFDLLGIARAGANYIMRSKSSVVGTSTLSQQLIKNTLLTNERSVKRKIKEMYLAWQLNRAYSKEKILEMYLNLLDFGHNASGIEQACKTFFGKSANDIGPLGATIIASLPKSSTRYSPYLHRDRLMGKIEAYPTNTPSHTVTLNLESANGSYSPLYTKFKEYIQKLTFEQKEYGVRVCNLNKDFIKNSLFLPDKNGCHDVNYNDLIKLVGNIIIRGDLALDGDSPESYTLEYTIGRKDVVASRMLEENKIDGKTFGEIIFNGLEFQFQKPQAGLKYPYFVMYIKEYLENEYGKDMNIKNKLRVYTTLDSKLQEYAENVVKEQVATNSSRHGAKSAALISMNNKTGELLAMVGGPDYFDEENGGNNNMTTALRQPGSSFKPIVYALALSKNPIGPESPITDAATRFNTYAPKNYDGKYYGLMSVGNALGNSRNIPAVKMFFLAGQEKAIVDLTRKLGITSLKGDYGASIALGAGEIRPIDMMQAYSVFANNGKKITLYAIDRIEDSDGTIIERHTPAKENEVFSPAASYVLTRILSNPSYRPAGYWRDQLSVPGHVIAAKTGTANKPPKKGSSAILPGDTWTVGYSPTITTVMWAGNVDGSALKGGCDGINCVAPGWKKFMTFALKDEKQKDFEVPQKGLFTYNTSKISGLLPSKDTPRESLVTNIMAVELTKYDSEFKNIEYDELCGGPVTSRTPSDAIIHAKVPTSKPIIDGYDPAWTTDFFRHAYKSGGPSGDTTTSTKPCERPSGPGEVTIATNVIGIKSNILQVSWSGNRMIKKIRIFLDNTVLKEQDYGENASTTGSDRISTNQIQNTQDVLIELVDIYGYIYQYRPKNVIEDILTPGPIPLDDALTIPNNITTTEGPTITLTNPSRDSINLYVGNVFNLRFSIENMKTSGKITITIDGKTIQTASIGEVFVIPISSDGLKTGKHTVTVTATDEKNRSDTKSFTLNILPR